MSIHPHKFLRPFVYEYSLLTQKNIMFLCSQKYGIQYPGKFAMAVFKIVQVMTENVRFAFLYVLSIRYCNSVKHLFEKEFYDVLRFKFGDS